MLVEILDFKPEYSKYFEILNTEWLEKYFVVEPIDREMLSNPKEYILDKGGKIFFAKFDDKIVGTVALIKEKEGIFELSKMAVSDELQSHGIGKLLLNHCIKIAMEMNATEIFLYSNTKLEKAINLYKKLGFIETPFASSEYERANIYMKFQL